MPGNIIGAADLVDPGAVGASPVRIMTQNGVKSWRKLEP